MPNSSSTGKDQLETAVVQRVQSDLAKERLEKKREKKKEKKRERREKRRAKSSRAKHLFVLIGTFAVRIA